jgi:hypothetical protein
MDPVASADRDRPHGVLGEVAEFQFRIIEEGDQPFQMPSDKVQPSPAAHVRKKPAASNYDFSTKKDVYFKGKGKASPFVLTQEVRSER